MKIYKLLSLALVSALALSTAGCGSASDDSQKKVKIGFAAPLTGDNALYGEGMKRAVQLAIDEANADQRTQDAGIVFELKAEDDAGDPKQAVNVANSLVGDQSVVAVVGHFNSGCTIPASPVYERAEMAMVTVSTNPQITSQGYKTANRVVARDNAQGVFAGEMAVALGYTKLALIDDSTPYGQGLISEFSNSFTKLGGAIVSQDQVPAKTIDFSALITKLKQKAPQAVYYAGAHTEGALLSKQMSEAGMTVPVIGGDMLYSPDYVTLAGAGNTEGDIATALGMPLENQPRGAEFLKKYRDAYDMDPEAYDSYAYDAALTIIEAVLESGSSDRATVAAAVRAGSIAGVTGEVAFDENGDNRQQVISAYKVQGGVWTAFELK